MTINGEQLISINTEKLIEIITDVLDHIDFTDKSILPSDFAEAHIILDSAISSLRSGKFSYDLTPYLREVVDTASPYNEASIIVVMKGAQIGFSQGVILPAILWKIAFDAGNIVSLSADDDLSKEFVEKRIDPVIQRCFVKDLIKPSTVKKSGTKRSGDTSKSKEFAGGSVKFGGLQSINKLGKQSSWVMGFFDDWESAKIADKEQGNLFDLIQQRFSTAANKMKQYFISTPHSMPSNIYNLYMMGDQRKWHVPCPCCGDFIVLKWYEVIDGNKTGVTFKKNSEGELIKDSVGYICQSCLGEFKESHKYEMNLLGVWIPTAKSKKEGLISYHIPALSAAPGMFGWTHYADQWCRIYSEGYEDKGKLKVFKNVVLGEPWEEKSTEVKTNKLIENTRDYTIRTVPSKMSKEDGNGKIVLLTMACDLNGPMDDARLDYEVVAWSAKGASYSIDQGSIGTYQPGDKSKKALEEGKRIAWTYRFDQEYSIFPKLLNDVMVRKYKSDDGRSLSINQSVIDAGHCSLLVYKFVEQYQDLCLAVMGDKPDKYVTSATNSKLFKPSSERPYLLMLDVNKYKDSVAERLISTWDKEEGDAQPAWYFNFPRPDYSQKKYQIEEYFKQLGAEEKELQIDDRTGEEKGYRWVHKKKSVQNHFLDCKVYNDAARDIFVLKFMKEFNKHEEYKTEATYFNFSKIMTDILSR